MRIHVITVGRARRGPEAALYEHYADRLAWPISLREIETKGRLKPAETRVREGELLLAAVPDGATRVALDERGEALTSVGLARRLGTWRDDGARDIAFLIGGAEGLDPSVRDGAALVLSLGPMTWPHLLVRALLAEQLYRAQSILAGHPYHRT